MAEPDGEPVQEWLVVWRKRYKEARRAGMDDREAREFAASVTDVAELRELVKRGCPPQLLGRIVL